MQTSPITQPMILLSSSRESTTALGIQLTYISVFSYRAISLKYTLIQNRLLLIRTLDLRSYLVAAAPR